LNVSPDVVLMCCQSVVKVMADCSSRWQCV